ncbi:MAG: ABC transporter ATP-binding protein [Acidimicrobiales bacterium]
MAPVVDARYLTDIASPPPDFAKREKIPRSEIDTRVRDAARILGLDDLLNRKPRALSGGQRQRVAMGRAIVRHPQAFLMDEPLSNLDAKLRVQMRAEIARLQHELEVTTIYVTHDQIEAMTMGDRVAVIRKGVLQQVDSPQVLYERPRNIFVAGFIGSPAMNLLEASLARSNGGIAVQLGDVQLPVPQELHTSRPALADYADRKVVVGIRPEDMEDAALAAGAPADRRIPATIELREALGSDVVVHFTVPVPPAVGDDVRELAVDVGAEILERVEQTAARGEASVIARLNPRTRAQTGDRMELVVDTTRLHFFDPDDGSAIYGSPEE